MNSSQPAKFALVESSGIGRIAEDTMVDTLFSAYRQGRSAPRPMAKNDWKERWQERLKAHTRVSLQDQFVLLRCTQLAGKGCASAAGGDITVACQLFGLAHGLTESKELSREARLRCGLELAAAEAYLDYFCGDFEQARSKLFDSLFCAQELEDKFGYGLLHVHRIHLLNNLVKVEVRANRIAAAFSLAADIILYLQNKTSDLPVPGSWGVKYQENMRNDDLQFLSAQLISELAASTVGTDRAVLGRAFRSFMQRVELDDAHPSWQREAYSWMVLKALYETSEDSLEYHKHCVPYLAAGPGAGVMLWHLTALDAATGLDPQCSAATSFKRQVLADLQKIPSLPRHLRAFVDRTMAACAQISGLAREA